MKRTNPIAARVALVAAGGVLMLGGVAGAAFADSEQGSDDVDVNVTIAPLTVPGSLAMTVAANTTTLAEGTSTDPTQRQFLGSLPSVTVTDTRTTIPAGAAWAVLGQASDFVASGSGGQPAISAANLGWTPSVVDPGSTYDVIAGPQVDTILDPGPNNVGLKGVAGPELLAMTNTDSATAQATAESWTADADLFLKVPLDTAAGTYKSVLTLSLFE